MIDADPYCNYPDCDCPIDKGTVCFKGYPERGMMNESKTPLKNASEHWLGELLAVIHRDGGHHLAKHGREKAVEDAMAKVIGLRAECAALKTHLQQLGDGIRKANERAEKAESERDKERDLHATLETECEQLRKEAYKERNRADAWVKAARELSRSLGLSDDESDGSIRDWAHICSVLNMRAEKIAVAEAREREAYERAAKVCEEEICACCWDDDAQAAAEHLADKIRALADERRNET